MEYDGVIMKPSLDDILEHHGIKGQQWGVQNGPPYPLNPKNYSRKEQKANYKKIKKAMENDKKKGPEKENGLPRYRETEKEIKNVLNESGIFEKQEMKDQLQKIKKLEDQWRQLRDEAGLNADFFSGNKYWDAMEKESYDQTYKWFEKNEPEHLKEAIAYNKGSKKNLDYIDHDFRKMYDGFSDQNWTKYESMWAKSPQGKAFKKEDKAFSQYWEELLNTGKNVNDYILGKYGKRDRGYLDGSSFSDKTLDSVERVLSDAIKDMGDKKLKK